MTFFTGIPPHEIYFFRIEGVHDVQYYLRDDVVLKMIRELNGRKILVGFDQGKIRDILQGFQYKIMKEIGGNSGGRRREVEEV